MSASKLIALVAVLVLIGSFFRLLPISLPAAAVVATFLGLLGFLVHPR